jgi:flagellar motor component MotA
MELIVEGIASIQAGVNPRLIKQKLNSLLPSEPVKKSEQAEAA